MYQGRLARLIYTTALLLATPAAFAYLLYRSIRQPAYRLHWGERLGRYRGPSMNSVDIWIHAVSVGETRAAQPLIESVLAKNPALQILITHMTPTGRETSERLFGARVTRAYVPYDFPWAMNRFLRHYRPARGLLMETEVWPNLIEACKSQSIPIALVNARLSRKSLRKALRFHQLIRPAVSALSAVLAQSIDDATRLKELGAANTFVTGNIKFDIEPPRDQLELGKAFRRLIGSRPVLLCASTRDGEEALLVAALVSQNTSPSTLLVLVPRHPQRFDEVNSLVRSAGLAVQKRSEGQEVSPTTRVWLGDSMGEMFAYYSAADIAYVGGGLLPFGTHNLIEACAVGCPVIVGPHTHNFQDIASAAIASGAALRVHDAAELMMQAERLLADGASRNQMAKKAVAFSQLHRGATQRTLEYLSI